MNDNDKLIATVTNKQDVSCYGYCDGTAILNIFGGVFPTFAPQLVMNFETIDMCCVGEGENAIVDLADRLARGEDYSDVTNLWVRKKNGTIKKNPITKPVDINLLP